MLLILFSCSANELMVERYDQVIKDRNLELRQNLRHKGRSNFRDRRSGRDRVHKYEKLEKMIDSSE